jgi:hypothetical protein
MFLTGQAGDLAAPEFDSLLQQVFRPKCILLDEITSCLSAGPESAAGLWCNERARRALLATLPEATPPPALPPQSTAEAIHLLDTQFPWLRGAER